MSAKAVVRMPGEGKQVTLAGKPMTFLVTGEDQAHLHVRLDAAAGFSTAFMFIEFTGRNLLCAGGRVPVASGRPNHPRHTRDIPVHSAGRPA